MTRWGDKPYYSLDWYLKQAYGSKVYKIALDAGFTCPNRDGLIGTGGCIFCSAGGSGDYAGDRRLSVDEQLARGIATCKDPSATQFIAYYQAFTNTYADTDYLREVYAPAFRHPEVVAVSIATRPDCIPEDTLALLCEYNRVKPVWIELGLQTMHDETAGYIRRGYGRSSFEEAVGRLRACGIPVIVHVILGLPGEDVSMMLETIDYLNGLGISGIKLQLLHVLEGTDLAADYRAGRFEALSEDAYVDLVVKCTARLSPDIVIHRITGDGPADLLIAPEWSVHKRAVLNHIHHELKARGVWQGCDRRRPQ